MVGKSIYILRFTEEETEAWATYVTDPRLHQEREAEWVLDSGLDVYRARACSPTAVLPDLQRPESQTLEGT